MTGFNMHVYEMLCRVVVFSEKYPYLFGPGTLAAELIEKVREAAMRLSEHAATQTSKKGAFRQGVDDREAARADLQARIDAIYRIASVNGLKSFELPRSRRALALVETANGFIRNLEAVKQLFVAYHMPEDFVDQLKVSADRLHGAINNQTFLRADQMGAAKVIDEARTNGLDAVKRLDPIITNQLARDATAFGVWLRMRRMDYRKAGRIPHNNSASPPSATPDAQTSAEPAQA